MKFLGSFLVLRIDANHEEMTAMLELCLEKTEIRVETTRNQGKPGAGQSRDDGGLPSTDGGES
jgi:hypothetical protein